MEQLHEQAVAVTKLRADIEAKAIAIDSLSELEQSIIPQPRTKVGLQYSTKKNSPYGISEGGLRLLEKADTVPARKYKKRHLKQLSIDDRTSIIHAVLIEK